MTPLDRLAGGRISGTRQWRARADILRRLRGDEVGPRWRRGSNSWRPVPIGADWRRIDPPCPECGGRGDALKAAAGWNYCGCGHSFVIGDYDWHSLSDVLRYVDDRANGRIETPSPPPLQERPEEYGPPDRFMHAVHAGDGDTIKRLLRERYEARRAAIVTQGWLKPRDLKPGASLIERDRHLYARFVACDGDYDELQAERRANDAELSRDFWARIEAGRHARRANLDVLDRLAATLERAEREAGVREGETLDGARHRNFIEATADARRRDAARARTVR